MWPVASNNLCWSFIHASSSKFESKNSGKRQELSHGTIFLISEGFFLREWSRKFMGDPVIYIDQGFGFCLAYKLADFSSIITMK
jgi:hypothetical protein